MAEQRLAYLAARHNGDDLAFLVRLTNAQQHLANGTPLLTIEQIEAAVAMRVRMANRNSGTRQYTSDEYRDVLARLYAASINTGNALAPEFSALTSRRTAERIISQAQEFIDPALRNGNSSASQAPQLGYRLVKVSNGTVIWETGEHIAALKGEIFHFGITSQFLPIPHPTTGFVQSRYSMEFLRANDLRFEPLVQRPNRATISPWEEWMITSYAALNGQRPPGNRDPGNR